MVLVLTAVLAVAILRGPRPFALWACGLTVAGFGAFESVWVFQRYVVPSLTVQSTVAHRNWIDAAAPSSKVGLVPSPWVAPPAWWEAEFWNRDVDRVVRIGRRSTYTPFPAASANVDFDTGRLVGDGLPHLLVLARKETRFSFAGAAPVATAGALALVRVRRPDRLAWATRGAGDDGWIRANRRATVRIFAGDRPLRRDVRASEDSRYLSSLLYPHKHPQERFYSMLPFLAQHGLELIDRLYEMVRVDCPDHRVVTL